MTRLVIFLALFIGLPASLFYLATSKEAMVHSQVPYSWKDMQQMQAKLGQFHPSQLKAGQDYSLLMTEQELNIAANYAYSQQTQFLYWQQRTRVLETQVAHQISLKLSMGDYHRYLNVYAELIPSDNLLSIQTLKVGDIILPEFARNWVEQRLYQQLAPHQPWIDQLNPDVRIINNESVLVNFRWQSPLASLAP